MNIKSIALSLSLVVMISLNACKKNDNPPKGTDVNVTITNPIGIENVKVLSAELKFKEINSGKTTKSSQLNNGVLDINLAEGSYDITLEGSIEYTYAGATYTGTARAFKEKVVINGPAVSVDLTLFLYEGKSEFVIKEIFFTGTVTPEGKKYNGDKYFIIHNNSDKVLYADSLMIAESSFVTTTKRIYTPDVMSTAFTATSIVMIPGSGKTYPIAPGKSFVVANNAINHKEFNVNSLDLSHADFELQLLSSINVDNPQVTDLININGYLTMHDRGFKSYVIGKMQGTVEAYKANNFYTYSYLNANGSTSSLQAYKIPNNWIQDAVNLSVQSVYEWIVTSPQLDMGWTFCGKVDSDATRYGKSVSRKVQSTNSDGRQVLQDTNNSTLDFNAESELSLK